MTRHPKGSTPKLTEALIEELATAIRHGCYMETSAALCGISKDSLYRWLRQADEDDAPPLLRALSDAVKKAMAEAEARDVAVIDKASQGGVWQAAAWRLERKHPNRWGRQARLQVEHHSGAEAPAGGSTVDLKKLSTDELLLLERALKDDEQEEDPAN